MAGSWSDVDDHGEPELRRAWRMAPDDPPLEVAIVDLKVPFALLEFEQFVPV